MPMTNETINLLNQITVSVPDKTRLSQQDEQLIKKTFHRIISENDEDYDLYEIKAWFENEGTWKEKSVIDRIVNIAHYVKSKHESTNKLNIVSDSSCGCGSDCGCD